MSTATSLSPWNLVLRCYAYKDGNQWIAICLNLSLAVQGDNLPEVKAKLADATLTYVREALNEDRQYASYLLKRKAPFGEWLRYWLFCAKCWCRLTKKGICELFNEVLPLSVVDSTA